MTSFFNSRNYFYDFHSYGIVSYRLMLPTYICMCIKLHSLILYSRQIVNYYRDVYIYYTSLTIIIHFLFLFCRIREDMVRIDVDTTYIFNLAESPRWKDVFVPFHVISISLNTTRYLSLPGKSIDQKC